VTGGAGDLRPGTRAVHAGLPEARLGEPFLPGPVLASSFHLAGDADPAAGYGRFGNPTWERYEAALGELEGGEVVSFASGMAAVSAVLLALVRPGDVLVCVDDAYPGVRSIAREHLEPRGVEVRGVPTDDAALLAALPGARLVWVESPSNPELRVVDLPALAAAARAAGALLAVDGTLATPLRQRPLELGVALSVASGTKALSGHSDLLIGHVASRDPELLAQVRAWRTLTGGIPGPFEAWLAHRSLATLGIRVERQEANAEALAGLLAAHPAVRGARWPGVGCVVAFELAGAEPAQRFIDACRLVADATSFGGVHASAERRARWGTDAVGEGFVRFSCGVEDTQDLLADVAAALDVIAG
jgi:cystathionine gamma-lyase